MKSRFIQNGYFFIANFRYRIVLFCFYLIALLFSFTLSFTVVGIPLVIRVLQTTTPFVQFERIQTKIYTDISTDSYDRKYNNGYIELGSSEISAYRSSHLVCCLLVNAEISDWHFQSH